MKIRLLKLSLIGLSIVGCATPHQGEMNFGDNPVPTGGYHESFEKWTNSEKYYSGGAQALQVTATLQSRDIVEQHVYMDAEKFHWTADQYRDSRQKGIYDNESATTVFLSLYTDKDENNNLDKANSNWNVFLDVNGKRVVPSSIKRVFENRAVLIGKYPYINVWSKNYLIKFPMPTSETTSTISTLTVAGVLGAVHLKFPR